MPAAHFPPSSFFIAAIAATHGVYKSENTKNTIAVIGVNILKRADGELPKSTESELTTLSFAINPEIRAVETLQSLNPSGLNTGAIKLPKIESMLSDDDFATLSLVSKVCRNHIITDAAKIIVNALVMNAFALS